MTPGPDVVDVEITIGVPAAPGLLGVYIHHPNPDGAAEAETRAHASGAEYTTYPIGPMPPVLDKGYVEVEGTNMYVAIGSMYVIAPLLAKCEEIAHLKYAVVYFATQPFGEVTPEEKVWLAARVPLVFSEEEN